MVWNDYVLRERLSSFTYEDKIQADLQGIALKQYAFNKWMDELERSGDGFNTCFKLSYDVPRPIKLAWWKCWFWWLIPCFFLGTNNRIRFRGWKIGHCLNCNASPYNGQVEKWNYDGSCFRGALIRCGKCGQLRWQPGEFGRDY